MLIQQPLFLLIGGHATSVNVSVVFSTLPMKLLISWDDSNMPKLYTPAYALPKN